jgi:hypothetical protein
MTDKSRRAVAGGRWAPPESVTDDLGYTHEVVADIEDGRYFGLTLINRDVVPFAAYIKCVIEDGLLTIGDLRVMCAALRRGNSLVRYLRMVTGHDRSIDYRNRGLGKKLLALALEYARFAGLHHAVGVIVAADLKVSPWLLTWYARQGFEVRLRDDQTSESVADIVIQL